MIVKLLALTLTLLISGNNVSICVGPLVGSGLLHQRLALLLAIIGFTIGLIAESQLMLTVHIPDLQLQIALATSLLLTLISELLKIPVSLMYIVTTSVLATSYFTTGNVNDLVTLLYCAFYWVVTLPLSLVLSLATVKVLLKFTSRNPVRAYKVSRFTSIFTAFLLCTAFGANNIGFLYNIMGRGIPELIACIGSLIFGVLLLGGRVLKKIAYIYTLSPSSSLSILLTSFMLAQIGTLLGIPLSFSIIAISSLFGVSLAYRVRIFDVRYIFTSLAYIYMLVPITFLIVYLLVQALKLF